ncbi:MAG TPA: hypothetical protein VFT59_02180 [Candidatus Saccharimonadales bacterium]|nr:hypothetical protein [Candidatus Saccharimonadales bacterium]
MSTITFFTIHRGLPRPLTQGALEMFSSQTGNAFYISTDPRLLIVALQDEATTTLFRTYMEARDVDFTETTEQPEGVEFRLYLVVDPLAIFAELFGF